MKSSIKPSTVILDYSNFSPNKALSWDVNNQLVGSVSTTKNASTKNMFGLSIEKSSKDHHLLENKYPMTPDNQENKLFNSKKKTPPKQKNEFYERIIEKILQKDLDSNHNISNLDNNRSDIKQKITNLTTSANESFTYFFSSNSLPNNLLYRVNSRGKQNLNHTIASIGGYNRSTSIRKISKNFQSLCYLSSTLAFKQGSLSPIKKLHIHDKNFSSSTKSSLGMIHNVHYILAI